MWQYTVIDKDGIVQTDIYQSDMNFKASEICRFLESCDFEVLELKQVEPLTIGTFLYKIIKRNPSTVAVYN